MNAPKYRTVIHANGVEFVTNYPDGYYAASTGLIENLWHRDFIDTWEKAELQADHGDGWQALESYDANAGPVVPPVSIPWGWVAVVVLLVAVIVTGALASL